MCCCWCFLKSSRLKCEKQTCWDFPAQPLWEVFLHPNTDSRCCKKSSVLSCVDLADLADLPQKAGIKGSSNRLSYIEERNTVHHPSSVRNIIHHSSSITHDHPSSKKDVASKNDKKLFETIT